MEKTPSEKRIDAAKQLGLPLSTLNLIFVKKREFREQAVWYINQEEEMGKELTYGKLENVLFACYQ
jgi:hypothetical protein